MVTSFRRVSWTVIDFYVCSPKSRASLAYANGPLQVQAFYF